jgi:hypothetical protein
MQEILKSPNIKLGILLYPSYKFPNDTPENIDKRLSNIRNQFTSLHYPFLSPKAMQNIFLG